MITKLLKPLLLIWSFLQLLFWTLSGNLQRGFLYIDKDFYPFYKIRIGSRYTSSLIFDPLVFQQYDLSEFFFYAMGPIVLYFAYTLSKN